MRSPPIVKGYSRPNIPRTCASAASIAARFSARVKSINASFANSPRCKFTGVLLVPVVAVDVISCASLHVEFAFRSIPCYRPAQQRHKDGVSVAFGLVAARNSHLHTRTNLPRPASILECGGLPPLCLTRGLPRVPSLPRQHFPDQPTRLKPKPQNAHTPTQIPYSIPFGPVAARNSHLHTRTNLPLAASIWECGGLPPLCPARGLPRVPSLPWQPCPHQPTRLKPKPQNAHTPTQIPYSIPFGPVAARNSHLHTRTNLPLAASIWECGGLPPLCPARGLPRVPSLPWQPCPHQRTHANLNPLLHPLHTLTHVRISTNIATNPTVLA